VLFVPAIAGVQPSALAETIWALGYSGLGVALLAQQGNVSRRQYVLGAVLGVAAIASAAVVTFSTSEAATTVVPENPSVTVPSGTVLHDSQIGNVPTVPEGASANNLEHRAGSH
jgi:hypothetical protein